MARKVKFKIHPVRDIKEFQPVQRRRFSMNWKIKAVVSSFLLLAICAFSISQFPTHTAAASGSATLNVVTIVNNNYGGTDQSSNFLTTVTGTDVSQSNFNGSSSGVTVTLDPGPYSVSVTHIPGYFFAPSNGINCSGSITKGQSVTCTMIAQDEQPTLTVIKHVINHGGDKVASEFEMNVSGAGITNEPFQERRWYSSIN